MRDVENGRTLKILRCSHRKISKFGHFSRLRMQGLQTAKTIFQDYKHVRFHLEGNFLYSPACTRPQT